MSKRDAASILMTSLTTGGIIVGIRIMELFIEPNRSFTSQPVPRTPQGQGGLNLDPHYIDNSYPNCARVFTSGESPMHDFLACNAVFISRENPNVQLVDLKGSYEDTLLKLDTKRLYGVRFEYDETGKKQITLERIANADIIRIPIGKFDGGHLAMVVQAALFAASDIRDEDPSRGNFTVKLGEIFDELDKNPDRIIFEFRVTGSVRQD